jgi:hypothetical protein
MDGSQFDARIAKIRARFASRLAATVEETDAGLARLAGDGGEAVAAVAIVYRRFHDVCGIGPTIGFDGAGRAARILVDGVLVEPFRAGRGLTSDEMAALEEGLAAFRIAASADIQSTESKSEYLS